MDDPGARLSLHIICPLRHELTLLRKAGVTRFATLHCCGPGPAAAERAVRELNVDPERDCVMLVGVAGGLSAKATPGRALLVTEVRDAEGTVTLRAPIEALAGASTVDCIACSTALPVTSVDAKRALRERSGADLVDLESLAFAKAAEARGLRWGIIRGISDGPDDALPTGLSECVADDGRTRFLAVAWQVLRRPGMMAALLHLQRASKRSMNAATEMVRTLAWAPTEAER